MGFSPPLQGSLAARRDGTDGEEDEADGGEVRGRPAMERRGGAVQRRRQGHGAAPGGVRLGDAAPAVGDDDGIGSGASRSGRGGKRARGEWVPNHPLSPRSLPPSPRSGRAAPDPIVIADGRRRLAEPDAARCRPAPLAPALIPGATPTPHLVGRWTAPPRLSIAGRPRTSPPSASSSSPSAPSRLAAKLPCNGGENPIPPASLSPPSRTSTVVRRRAPVHFAGPPPTRRTRPSPRAPRYCTAAAVFHGIARC
nr:vegetative cell wall protein gp1-like [Aegilops tauschii subsp. strangulata]